MGGVLREDRRAQPARRTLDKVHPGQRGGRSTGSPGNIAHRDNAPRTPGTHRRCSAAEPAVGSTAVESGDGAATPSGGKPRRRSVQVSHLPVLDQFQFLGPNLVAVTVSLKIQWEAVGPIRSLGSGKAVPPNDAAAFLGQFAKALARGVLRIRTRVQFPIRSGCEHGPWLRRVGARTQRRVSLRILFRAGLSACRRQLQSASSRAIVGMCANAPWRPAAGVDPPRRC